MNATTTEPASVYRSHPRDLHVAPHLCAGVNCRTILYTGATTCTWCVKNPGAAQR